MNKAAKTWLELCEEYVRDRRVSSRVVDVLRAFGPQATPCEAATFEELENEVDGSVGAMLTQIETDLSEHVDPGQASMFRRRYAAMMDRLKERRDEAHDARLMRVGLYFRAGEILESTDDPTLRIRALTDFYYSQNGLIEHLRRHRSDLSELPSLVESLEMGEWSRVARGIRHLQVEADTREGPLRLNALKIDPNSAQFECVQVPNKNIRRFPEFVQERKAVSGVSGGFFLYSENDIAPPSERFDPVGLLLHNGRVVEPPVFNRGAFMQLEDGRVMIEQRHLAGVQILWDGNKKKVAVGAVNTRVKRMKKPTAYTRAFGKSVPRIGGSALQFVGAMVRMYPKSGNVPIPLNGFVLQFPDGPEWSGLAQSLSDAQNVSYRLPAVDNARIKNAMAGGPILLKGGQVRIRREPEDFVPVVPPVTFAEDETRDKNLLPRMAIGLTPHHETVILAVDGRHLDAALGVTLRQTAELMRGLGCIDALNLDGGSSKRMVIRGRTVDRGSTEVMSSALRSAPQRPVHTAILIHGLKKAKGE